MHNHIPKVHIMYAWTLDKDRRALFTSKNYEYPAYEEVLKENDRVKDLWQVNNENDQLIIKIIEVLGVSPQYDFEFYTYGSGLTPMSVPLLLPLFHRKSLPWAKEKLLEIIVHEIIHRFASSTRPDISYNTNKYWEYVRNEYSELSLSIQNHLIVYAVLDKVLPVVLSSEEISNLWEDVVEIGYKQAVELVKEKGADYFINEFKEHVVKM